MCKEEASCGPSLAQNHRCDWCYVPSSCEGAQWNFIRGSHDFCEYKPEDSFKSLSADQKMSMLWKNVNSDKRAQPLLSTLDMVTSILTSSMITTFDNSMEVHNKGRTKVIHGQGAVVQFDLEVENSSPYTGVMMPGTHRGLMRLGSATPADGTLFPGLAVKFLRSGIHSANTVALLHSGSAQEQFFAGWLTNHVAPPFVLDVVQKFNQPTGCRSMTGLSDMCTYTQDGSQVADVIFPYEIKFEAPDPAQFPLNPNAYDSNSEILRTLETIPSGTHLYNFYTKATPSANWVRIAKIVTKSAFTTSWFGDTQLFFRHQRMEEDFMKHPEWIEEAMLDKERCDGSVDREGNVKPLSEWKCPGVHGIVPPA